MEKFYYKSRPLKPHKKFNSKFEKSLMDLAASFLESKALNHAATKGVEREKALLRFLNENLPNNYGVGTGEIVDCNDNVSPQLDVIIYDKTKTIPLYNGDAIILPAESLLASIEVKSLLTKDELAKSIKAARQLKQLQPYMRQPKSRGRESSPVKSKFACRYFHCLFAYHTNLSAENWAQNEWNRFKEATRKNGYTNLNWIDRLYVNDKGIINPSGSNGPSGINDRAPSVKTFMYFYMHLLNFLMRENDRRKPVPYELYSGRLSSGWKKLD